MRSIAVARRYAKGVPLFHERQAPELVLSGRVKLAALTGLGRPAGRPRPAPRGISLEQHRRHMLAALERGVGLYPPGRGNSVHGDFDKSKGGRRTW